MAENPELEMVRTMLAEAEIGRLATVSPRGNPTLAPFWFFFDGTRVVIHGGDNATMRNIRRNPAVSLLVDFGTRYADLRGAVVRGTGRVFPPDEAPAEVRAGAAGYDRKYHAYRLEMQALGDRHRTVRRPPVLLAITPQRAQWFTLGGSIWGHVEFPPPGASAG
jgi:hypothetical protein